MFGTREPEWADLVAVATRLTLELIGDSDALYHDAHHTALVTLVGQDILRGRLLAGRSSRRDWLHITWRCSARHRLCPGRLPRRRPRPMRRSTLRARRGPAARRQRRLARPLACRARQDLVRARSAIIGGSMPSASPRDRADPLPGAGGQGPRATADEAGLVRAADLIGQLADPLYLRRAGALFTNSPRSACAAKLGYNSAADLIEKYPRFFWDQVEPYIGDALRCLRRTMEGKQWIAHLYAHVFTVEHQLRASRPRARPQPWVRPDGD